jgi:hypothetical protein
MSPNSCRNAATPGSSQTLSIEPKCRQSPLDPEDLTEDMNLRPRGRLRAALGIAGNLLARMSRNYSLLSFLALAAVIAVVSLLLLSTLRQESVPTIPILGLLLALLATAGLGAWSQTGRENPSLSLNIAKPEHGALTVTAKAGGSGLRSNEKMLLRLLGLTGSFATDDELKEKASDECRWGSLIKHDPAIPQHVLAWVETGPNVSGDANAETTIPVPDGLRYVCAFAILSPRGAATKAPGPSNWALIDVAYATSSTVPTSSTIPPAQ